MTGTFVPGSASLAGSGMWGDRRLPAEKAEEGLAGGGWAGRGPGHTQSGELAEAGRGKGRTRRRGLCGHLKQSWIWQGLQILGGGEGGRVWTPEWERGQVRAVC